MFKSLHFKSLMLLLCALIVGSGSVWAANKVLTFSLSSNPGGWPTANSTTLTNYTYTLDNVDYTFALKNVKQNSGYLMLTSTAVLGLPAIESYKLTKVVAHNSNSCSTSTHVGISSSYSSANYIAGGAYQTWSTTGSSYTYNLSSTSANTVYYLYVTNKNAQIISLELTYEETGGSQTETCVTPTFSPEAGVYTSAQNVTLSTETSGATIYYTMGDNPADPTTSSSVYSSAIPVSSTTTIKAMAVKSGMTNSSVASATYTILNLAHAGTEADPYSVADARIYLNAQSPVNGVYVKGIISQIDSYSSNTITYWISDDGTKTNQFEVYKGKGLNGANFSSVSDLTIGTEVVVSGNITLYQNTTYEFSSGSSIVSMTAATVETPVFSVDGGTYYAAQTVTLTCATEGATIKYSIDNTNWSDYSSALTISTTTTLYAKAVKDSKESAVVNATYTIKAANATGGPNNPYTVAQARSAIDNGTDITNVYVSGKVCTGGSNLNNGALIYWISDDGTETDKLEIYKGKGINGVNFEANTDIQVNDEVTVNGNLTKYNSTYEFAEGSILTAFNRPTPTGFTVTISNNANVSSVSMWINDNNLTDISSGDEVEAGTTVFVNPTAASGYEVTGISVVDGNNSNVTVTANTGNWSFTMPSSSVTVSINTNAVTVNDYAELPFSFDDGRADIANTTGLTQEGLDSDYSSSPKLKFNTAGDYVILKINERPGTLTFDIKGNTFSGGTFKVQTSEDGSTYTDLKTYTELGNTQSEEFSSLGENVRYIKWIYTNKSSGNVALGNIELAAYVAPGNSAPVWSELPTPTIAVNEEYELDLSTYVTGTPTPSISLSTSVSNSFYEFEDGLLIFQPTEADTYVFTFTAENSEGDAEATLTVTAADAITYSLASSITSGKHYVIASGTDGDVKVMGAQNTNNRAAASGSVSGTTLSVTPNAGVYEFVIYGPDANGYYTIYNSENGYLYAVASSNYLKSQNNVNASSQWTITFDDTENNAIITAPNVVKDNQARVIRFNSTNNPPIFSCYLSGQSDVYLYEKSGEASPTESKTLNAYGYATYCSKNALDFTGNSDVTAWAITAANSTTGEITFSQITGKAPAGTGMLLKGTASKEVSFTSATGTVTAPSSNLLEGTSTAKDVTTGQYYGLSGNAFVPVNAGTVPAGKALLPALDISAARLTFVFEDETTTGIVNNNREEITNNRYYNLNGQRVDQPAKGLYIVNGKKVIMK